MATRKQVKKLTESITDLNKNKLVVSKVFVPKAVKKAAEVKMPTGAPGFKSF